MVPRPLGGLYHSNAGDDVATNGDKNGRAATVPSLATIVVTNSGKLLGLAGAFNEFFVRPEARNSVLVLCGLFVMGAQAAENIALRSIDRFFGRAGGE